METHHDKKQISRDTCKNLKEQGLISYRGLATATGIDYQRMRSFMYSGNLGPEDTAILYEWLVVHGHIKASRKDGAPATMREHGDVLEHAQVALQFALDESKNPGRTRRQCARLLLKYVHIFWDEWAKDLAKFGNGE